MQKLYVGEPGGRGARMEGQDPDLEKLWQNMHVVWRRELDQNVRRRAWLHAAGRCCQGLACSRSPRGSHARDYQPNSRILSTSTFAYLQNLHIISTSTFAYTARAETSA